MNDLKKDINSRLIKFEKLGVELQSSGTKLIGKAPHIAPLAWMHTIFKGLTEKEILELEKELNTDIPKDYQEFLKISNGLHIFNTTFCLNGLRKSYDRTDEIENRKPFCLKTANINERPLNSKMEYFFIGSYDWDGSYLYINKKNNKIYRCDRENAEPLNEWDNLTELIISEIDRLSELHNENGTEKNEDEPKIPNKTSR
ncbi:MAG: SMI1/KNR4 family protein [Bacteroidales bacterium]|nr:SMI1/KNR4 family protein [Bacteroidales bacterium]